MKFPIKAKHKSESVRIDFDVPMESTRGSRCVDRLKRVLSEEFCGRITDLYYKHSSIENDRELREACLDATSRRNDRVPIDVIIKKEKKEIKPMIKYEKKKKMDPKKNHKQNRNVFNDSDVSDDSDASEVGHSFRNYVKDHRGGASSSKSPRKKKSNRARSTTYKPIGRIAYAYASDDESNYSDAQSGSDDGQNYGLHSCYKCGDDCLIRYWCSSRPWDNLCGGCWRRGGTSNRRSQWLKLTSNEVPRPTLSRGDDSDDVKLLQKRLYDLGFLSRSRSDPSGYYGRRTEEAVQEFRNAFGVYGTSAEKNVYNSSAAKAMKRIVRDNVQNPV